MPILTLCMTVITICFLLVTAYRIDSARAEKKFWGRFAKQVTEVFDAIKTFPAAYSEECKNIIVALAEAAGRDDQENDCYALGPKPDADHQTDKASSASESMSAATSKEKGATRPRRATLTKAGTTSP